MSHGSPIPIGAFETPDVRLARLRTQLGSTSQSMGDTVTGLVDLEARRRAMEDNLRKAKRQAVGYADGVKNPSHYEYLSDTVYKNVETE